MIVTKDRAASLRETLAALGRVRVPEGLAAELILVDNGSTDATADVLRDAGELTGLPTRPRFDGGRGKTQAVNRAMASARGDIFLFTDDDVRPPAEWIGGMCRPIADGEADAVAGGIRAAGHLARPWLTPVHLNWLACTDADAPAGHVPALVGANMAFHRRVLEKVPQFDPEIGAGARGNGEDTIFSMQLEEAGYRRTFRPHVSVEHHFDAGRLTRRAFERQADKRGELDAYLKHHWFHTPSRFPRLRLAQLSARYGYQKLTRRPTSADPDAIADWELPLLEGMALYRHYLTERHAPRKYGRRGLRKLPTGGEETPAVPACPGGLST